MKLCGRCKIDKEHSVFLKRDEKPYGFCKICRTELNLLSKPRRQKYYQENKDRIAEKNTNYVAENKEKVRNRRKLYHENNKGRLSQQQRDKRSSLSEQEKLTAKDKELKRRYGITLAERDDMLQTQGGLCAICKSNYSDAEREFHVDHCHTSSVVRGILCHKCNLLLGFSGDNIATLRSAINYLEIRTNLPEIIKLKIKEINESR